MINNYRVLEDVVRDSYGGVVWTHKIQEKQADIYAEKFKKMETINIVAASLTSAGIIAIIFTDPLWLKLISAIVSFATVYITAYYKSFDLQKLVAAHKATASKMIDNVNILSKLGANELTTIALKASSSANTIISSLKASIGNYASQITSILNNPFLTDSERENQIELIEAKIKALVDEGKTKITTLFSISEIVVSLSSTVSGLKNTGFDTSSFVLDFQKLLANVNTKPSDLSEVKNKSDINDVIKTNEKTFLGTDSQQTIQNLITETDKKIKENEEKLKNKAISPDEKKRLELELVLYRSENNLLKMLS